MVLGHFVNLALFKITILSIDKRATMRGEKKKSYGGDLGQSMGRGKLGSGKVRLGYP